MKILDKYYRKISHDKPLRVIAPDNIRESVAVPVEGESAEQLKRRNDLFLAVLDAAGY